MQQAHLVELFTQKLQNNPMQNSLDMLSTLDKIAPISNNSAEDAPSAPTTETAPEEDSETSLKP